MIRISMPAIILDEALMFQINFPPLKHFGEMKRLTILIAGDFINITCTLDEKNKTYSFQKENQSPSFF